MSCQEEHKESIFKVFTEEWLREKRREFNQIYRDKYLNTLPHPSKPHDLYNTNTYEQYLEQRKKYFEKVIKPKQQAFKKFIEQQKREQLFCRARKRNISSSSSPSSSSSLPST